MTIISCGLDHERSTGLKKWRAPSIRTRSSNHELRDRDGEPRAATTKSCHPAKDRHLVRSARGGIVARDCFHVAAGKRTIAGAGFVVRPRFVWPHVMRP